MEMYCPQCGQQQISVEMRFCSRCGFPLGGVAELISSGGVLPASPEYHQKRGLSPRQKGVRQGVMWMLSSLLIVPMMAIISVFIVGRPEILIPLAALVTFVGGLLRLVYARLYEENVPEFVPHSFPPAPQPTITAKARVAALPPQQAVPPADFSARRVHTAELAQPPSVTEHTTKLLDKDEAIGESAK